MSDWNEAPIEVINIAENIINKYHPELLKFNIAFVMKSEEKFKKKPYQKWAQASKIPAKLSAFLEYDFLIWIQEEIWEDLTDEQKRALIDHELSHCGEHENSNGGVYPALIPHDFEEFSGVIKRYGLWRPSLVDMGKAVQGYVQPKFPNVEKIEIVTPSGRVTTLTGDQLEKLAQAKS